MTNKGICMKYAGCAYCKGKEKCADPEQRCTVYNLVEEITALKDQQFKEYLEKKMAEYVKDSRRLVILDIINELSSTRTER